MPEIPENWTQVSLTHWYGEIVQNWRAAYDMIFCSTSARKEFPGKEDESTQMEENSNMKL